MLKKITFCFLLLIFAASAIACSDDVDCKGPEFDCIGNNLNSIERKCVEGVCQETFTLEKECGFREQYCSGDRAVARIGFCGGDKCRTRTQTIDMCRGDRDYCVGNEAWHDDHKCQSGKCIVEKTLTETCVSPEPYCSGDFVRQNRRFCGGGECRSKRVIIDACKSEKNECSNYDFYHFEEYCENAKCHWKQDLSKKCSEKVCDGTTLQVYGNCLQDTCVSGYIEEFCSEECGAVCKNDDDCEIGSCENCQCVGNVPEFSKISILVALSGSLFLYYRKKNKKHCLLE